MTDKINLAADTPKPEVNTPQVTPVAQPEKSAPSPEQPDEKSPSSK